jgi:hypothetical protein
MSLTVLPALTFVIPAPSSVILAKAGTHWDRAACISHTHHSGPTLVIPAKAGIQKGRATRISSRNWIPDRAADHL